jgi:cleavage stimulation factor subunit 2
MLQRTTPDQARTVLTGQPQISYALIALMVKMNAVNVDVLQVRLFFQIFDFPFPRSLTAISTKIRKQ